MKVDVSSFFFLSVTTSTLVSSFPTETKFVHCFLLSERKIFEELMQLLGVQVQEMKSLSNNIRYLESKVFKLFFFVFRLIS